MEDLHAKFPHRWISPKAKASESKMHGHGIVAIEPIKKDEVIAVLGGIIVPMSEIEEYRSVMGHEGRQIDHDFFICPSDRKELEEQGVCNHSCEPNCGFLDVIKFVAMRDIETSEELTLDYATCETHFEPFECKCGSENCRKTIKPTDWQMPELQKKYDKYVARYLQSEFQNKTNSYKEV